MPQEPIVGTYFIAIARRISQRLALEKKFSSGHKPLILGSKVMITQTVHTTRILDEAGEGVEIELELDMAPGEPDVGIHGPYIDDWKVISVEGNTSADMCKWATDLIIEEYGDDKFVERLYDEGVGAD